MAHPSSTRSPSGRPPSPGKRPWSQPLADLVGKAIDPVLARQGFSESELIVNWDDIVGARFAAISRPIRLQWPARGAGAELDRAPAAATLVVRIEGGFALEFQHMTDQVLARVNGHFGWRCVGRIVFRQGPIERPQPATARRREPSAAALAKASASVDGIADDPLRAALARLGAHVAGPTDPAAEPSRP